MVSLSPKGAFWVARLPQAASGTREHVARKLLARQMAANERTDEVDKR